MDLAFASFGLLHPSHWQDLLQGEMGPDRLLTGSLLTVSDKLSECPAQGSGGPRSESQACHSYWSLNFSSSRFLIAKGEITNNLVMFLDHSRLSINGSYSS